MMDCSTAKSNVFAYIDGELGLVARDQLEAHLARCSACRRLVDFEVAFRETYVEQLRPDPAPDRVRQQVATLLDNLVNGKQAARRKLRLRRFALGVAAALLVTIGLSVGMAIQAHRGTRTRLAELADAAVDQHQKLVRDLLPADIKDVSPKAAEEWFRKRLAFNISLPDLRNESLTFLGGRISHLGNVEVAALEYQVDQKHVSLFIIPEETYEQLQLKKKPKFKVISHRGYDLIIWRSHGTGYALVSEIGGRSCLVCHSPEEKLEFATEPASHL